MIAVGNAGTPGRAAPSGYCQRMEQPVDRDRTAPAAVDGGVGGDDYDAVAEQDRARRARARRDEALTPAARLERLHRLCAQLATMTSARRSGE